MLDPHFADGRIDREDECFEDCLDPFWPLSSSLGRCRRIGPWRIPSRPPVAKARAVLIKEDLGGGVYVFRAPEELDYWTSTDTVVVVNDEDVVVFDSCTRAVTAKAVIAEIRKLTPKPVRVLVNSHWHQDHWSGNDEYVKAFPGLRTSRASRRAATSDARGVLPPRPRGGPEAEALGARNGIQTGKLPDGTALTAKERAPEEGIVQRDQFMKEVAALPRIVPERRLSRQMSSGAAMEFR